MSRPLQRVSGLSWSIQPLLVLLCLLVLLPGLVRAVVNITLEDTASQIIYSPRACGLTLSSAGTETCNSSWCVLASSLPSHRTRSSVHITSHASPSSPAPGGSSPLQTHLTARSPRRRAQTMRVEASSHSSFCPYEVRQSDNGRTTSVRPSGESAPER